MTERVPARRRCPLTIPLAAGPVAAWVDRSVAAVVCTGVAAVVVALAMASPDRRGFGTHEQLGLDPCGWPSAYGIPCPTCGCTTAACLLLHGNVIDAFVVQPFGALSTIVAVLLGAHAVCCLWRSRSFVDLLVRLPVGRLLGVAVLGLLLAWWYKYLVFEP